MGANGLGPRKLRALSRWTGLQVARAFVLSHVESGRWVTFYTTNGQRGELDRRTNEWGLRGEEITRCGSCSGANGQHYPECPQGGDPLLRR